jgi:hypothetical protein
MVLQAIGDLKFGDEYRLGTMPLQRDPGILLRVFGIESQTFLFQKIQIRADPQGSLVKLPEFLHVPVLKTRQDLVQGIGHVSEALALEIADGTPRSPFHRDFVTIEGEIHPSGFVEVEHPKAGDRFVGIVHGIKAGRVFSTVRGRQRLFQLLKFLQGKASHEAIPEGSFFQCPVIEQGMVSFHVLGLFGTTIPRSAGPGSD